MRKAPLTRRASRHSRCKASAFLAPRTAAEGRLCSPRKRGEVTELAARNAAKLMTSIPRDDLAEHHVHGLHLGVAQKLVDALLAAEPGILQAAERRAVEVPRRAVDPDVAGLDGTGGAERGLEVVGEDRGG